MYSNYNGDYLEGFLTTAKTYMRLSKKYRHALNLRLYHYHDMQQMEEGIQKALIKLEEVCNYHYYTSKKYVDMSDYQDVLDKCFATDDVMYDDKNNILTLIDWTSNSYAIESKVQKHKTLSPALNILADNYIVVCMLNIEAWDDLPSEDIARSTYKVMKAIAAEVHNEDYQGFLILDAKDLI
jgi:hypothetical protein